MRLTSRRRSGVISDALASRYPTDSLRYALSIAVLLTVLSAWLFWRAGEHLPAELLTREESETESARPSGVRATDAAALVT